MSKKQSRSTKTIEVGKAEHKLFSIMCIQKDLTQAELFKEILEDFRLNGNK
jgi:hypothetical protein